MLVEPVSEVTADCLPWLVAVVRAEAIGDELQVLFQVLLRPRYTDELHESISGIVPDAPIDFEDRDDAIVVSWEGRILAGVELLIATVGVDESRGVEAVTTHHAADGVREQSLDVFFTVRPVKHDLISRDFR